ncbi:hypothetical protein PROAA_610073 [Candidatus Propionivibrio aalborgensis]|uniref:Uncharacterized protein n=1 Tax=Candidatus Propionivibrio aalborgensis TaxID=1860101 RepID=A0A1A8Y2T8_9RHOO|nr:hypothetical protein [Candidatus Propionivibrio aalborgensis]SBT10713.1 hypothetical protein PROAA_610073 [Candidatus Propionivibrio aalborgensis]
METTEEVERLMKRCQIGVGGRNALDTAHERYQRGNDVPLVEPLPMVKG